MQRARDEPFLSIAALADVLGKILFTPLKGLLPGAQVIAHAEIMTARSRPRQAVPPHDCAAQLKELLLRQSVLGSVAVQAACYYVL